MAKSKNSHTKERPTKRNETRAGGVRQSRRPNIDHVNVHREFITRRLQGGSPITPEAYARAVEQWQQLPGSVLHVVRTGMSRPKTTPVLLHTGGTVVLA